MEYTRIKEIPTNTETLSPSPQLKALAQIWVSKKEQLQEYEQKFNKDLQAHQHTHKASFSEAKNNSESNNHYFHKQIIKIANKHDYYADTKHYKAWSRLVIKTDNIFEIVFSLHGYEHRDNGVMAISGFTFEKDISGKQTSEIFNIKSAQQEIFVFNYLEEEQEVVTRFDEWFKDTFVVALAGWQQTIA